MASTPLLGLSLPADGTTNWGTLVNTSITALLDSAVAGTTTLSSDADVTLSATTEATNQARQAIILWNATGTVTRNITAPAQSKTYVVINATGGTQSIVFRGTGPTTGVTIPAGKAYMLAWKGTDFVTIGVTSVNLATDVTGVLAVANGGTGQSTQQDAINALAGAVTSGQYLRGNGTNVGMSAIQAGDLPYATGTAPGVIQLVTSTLYSGSIEAATTTANRMYGLQANTIGRGVVNVPWTDTTYLPATSTVAGLIELNSDAVQTTAANAVTTTANRTYGLQVNAAGQGVVNVPWTDTVYTLPAATDTVLGGIKLGSNTVQTTAANAVTTDASRTYALQVNSSGQAVVNVPWTGGSGGTVTGVGATAPVQSSGGTAPTISLAANYGDTLNPYASKTANLFLAAPDGAAGVPAFRAIVAADIPTLNQNTTGTAANLAAGTAGQIPYQTGVGTTGFTAVGANGYLLQSLGSSSAPVWVQKTSANTANTVVNRDASGGFAVNQLEITTGYGITWDSGGASDPYQSYVSRTILGNTASVMEFGSPGIQYLYLNAGTAGPAGLWLDPSTGGSGQIGTIGLYNLNFYRNEVLYQTLDANGTVLASGKNLGLGGTSPATTGAGITFPATQSSSSNVNTLDDYEEGTFTPTVTGSTTAGSVSYGVINGTYTKVGRLVTFTMYVGWYNGFSGAGDLRLALPFACDTGNFFIAGTTGAGASSPTTAYPVSQGSIAPGNAYININVTSGINTQMTTQVWTAFGGVNMTGFYYAAT